MIAAPTMDKGPVLLVCRGQKDSYRGSDINGIYNCIAEKTGKGNYVAVELQDGQVTSRSFYRSSQKQELEKAMGAFRGAVFLDQRENRDLLESPAASEGIHKLHADPIIRAKSASEIKVMEALAERTYASLRLADAQTTQKQFRAAVRESDQPVESAGFRTRKTAGFVEYRGGYRSPEGLSVELTRVEAVPGNKFWEDTLDRCYRGLEAVAQTVRAGKTVSELNNLFLSHVDSSRERVYGNVVSQVGWTPHQDCECTHLQPYDAVRVGVTVEGEDGLVAHLFRSVHCLEEPEPEPEPEPLAPSSPLPARPPSPAPKEMEYKGECVPVEKPLGFMDFFEQALETKA